MIVQHEPTGWNTWDFRGFNRLVYLDRGNVVITVQYAIWDEELRPPQEVKNRGGLYDTFRWTDVTRLGPHAPLGLPAELEFRAGDTPYQATAVDQSGTLRLTVRPLAQTRQRVVFRLLLPDGAYLERRSATSGRFAGCQLKLQGATWPQRYFLNVAEPYAVGRPGQPATLLVKPRRARGTAPGTLAAWQRCQTTGHGALDEAPQAMIQAVTWNTLYDSRRRLVTSPVSRDWCADWKGVAVWCWDTYLVGMLTSYAAPQLSWLNFEAVSAAIDELGHVPNYYMAHGAASLDRSMPPLGSYMIWKTQCLHPDRRWLAAIYPKLARWHLYWMKHRSGRRDGLLQWGSDAAPAYEFPQLLQDNPQLQHSAKCAMYESGLDNSPMYDDVPFNERTHTLELDDVGLCSYYAMDCEALARIAACLGKSADAARYRREYAAMAARINEHLWDEENGIYCNRHWSNPAGPGRPSRQHSHPRGKAGAGPRPADADCLAALAQEGAPESLLSRRWSPTSFFPLIAGVAPPDRAARMIREHLLNEDEFWGQWVIPSIARRDPAFPDNDYWRGRIWGPFNFLVAEGLRRYRFDAEAAALAQKSLDLFMTNWRADGGVYENYNATTGVGADVWNAARLYHWGGLLVLIAMQELIDAEPTGYLRCGSLNFPDATLRRVHLAGDLYDVSLDTGVRVLRNGKRLLDCTTRAIIRVPVSGAPDEPISVTARQAGRLMLAPPLNERRLVRLADGATVAPRCVGNALVWDWSHS